MTTLTLLIVIVIIAILMWAVPMKDFMERLCYVVALVCVLLWVLGLFGVLVPVGIR